MPAKLLTHNGPTINKCILITVIGYKNALRPLQVTGFSIWSGPQRGG